MALERDVISNRQLYDDLMQRAKVTGVTGEYKGTNVQIIDAAEMPRSPDPAEPPTRPAVRADDRASCWRWA